MTADDIPKLLNEFVEEYRFQPFEWGKADCTQNAREWVYRLTGDRPYPELEEYSTELGATKAMLKLGYKSIPEAVDALFERVSLNLVRRGDLVLGGSSNSSEFLTALGICVGDMTAFPDAEGLGFRLTEHQNIAWRVV